MKKQNNLSVISGGLSKPVAATIAVAATAAAIWKRKEICAFAAAVREEGVVNFSSRTFNSCVASVKSLWKKD